MPSAAHAGFSGASFARRKPPVAQITTTITNLIVGASASQSYGTTSPVTVSSWDFGDGAKAQGVNVSHTYAAAGTYTITYTAHQADGMEATAQASVTVTASSGGGGGTTPTIAYDWSDTNQPWVLKQGETLTDGWPSDAMSMIVDYVPDSTKDFVDNLDATIQAAGRPVIIRLPAGTYDIKNFSHPQTAANYGLGYYNSRLRGFLGAGADQTFIQMAPNSYSQDQLNTIRGLTSSPTSDPIGFSMLRLGAASSPAPAYVAGITFRGGSQQFVSGYAAGIADQTAPWNGVGYTYLTGGVTQFVRFQGCCKAATSSPPFECAPVGALRSEHTMRRCEIDGRMSPYYDQSQPRQSGLWMGNGETGWTIEDTWMHHSLRSRYAVNDGNRAYQGYYTHRRCKIEQVTNIADNNGGQTLASCAGYENCSANITWENCILKQDNPTSGFQPAHIGLTNISGQSNVNPAGGQLVITDPITTNANSAIDGFLYIRAVSDTHWYTDGLNNTITATRQGVRLQPYVIPNSGVSAQDLQNAGVAKETHYLVRTS